MESIIKNNQETHVINQDFWAISIMRIRDGLRQDNAPPGLFKPIKFTNGLFDHAFIIIEGVNQSVRFAKKIDLYAEKSKLSQSSG